MSGIGFGLLLALSGFLLCATAHEQAGLFFVIIGFVGMFSGMASEQDRKRLAAGPHRPHLPLSPRFPALGSPSDPWNAPMAAPMTGPVTLSAIPAPFSMEPGEYACYRVLAAISEVRQLPRLGGGVMTSQAQPPVSDEGELYVTTRRLFFSGHREIRDFPLADVASAHAASGVVELWRRGRPCPTLLAVSNPFELAAYIEAARAEMLSPTPAPAMAPPMQPGFRSEGLRSEGFQDAAASATQAVRSQTMHEKGREAASASILKCPRCGAANGLSANFCQNCSAPIGQARMPTLNHPGRSE